MTVSPLIEAVQKKNVLLVKKLLHDHSVNVNDYDHNGDTALHHASLIDCTSNRCDDAMEILRLFINDKRVDKNQRDMEWRTPLLFAASSFSKDGVRILCEEVRHLDLNAYDVHGHTALMVVSQKPYHPFASEMIQILLERGANYRIRSRQYIDEWILNAIQQMKQSVARKLMGTTKNPRQVYPKTTVFRIATFQSGKTAYQIALTAFHLRFPSEWIHSRVDRNIVSSWRESQLHKFGVVPCEKATQTMTRQDHTAFFHGLSTLYLLFHAKDNEIRSIFMKYVMKMDHSQNEKGQDDVFRHVKRMKPDLLKQLYYQYL